MTSKLWPATHIVNVRFDTYSRYIGRGHGSIYGNPFSHLPGTLAQFQVATLQEAIEQYALWLTPELIKQARRELTGEVLGCWCRPREGFQGRLLCHGQILAALCDGIEPEEVE